MTVTVYRACSNILDTDFLPLLFLHISLAHWSEEVSSDIWMFGFDL